MTMSSSEQPLQYETNVSAYYAPVAGRAKRARIAMMVAIASCAVGGVLLFLQPEMQNITPDPAQRGLLIALALTLMVGGCFQSIAMITSMVLFLMWVHRANRAARQLSQHPMQFTPGWAVGWWFIPLANLVQPFKIIKEIRIASVGGTPETSPSEGKILAWWLLYLFSGFLQQIGTLIINPQLPFHAPWVGVGVSSVGVACVLVSGVLCLQIIKEITANLEARGSDLIPAPGTPTVNT